MATTAAPTSAAVKRMCGSRICVATAYQGTRYVQDITVFTRGGLPGTLRAFAGSYRQSRANDDRHVFISIRRSASREAANRPSAGAWTVAAGSLKTTVS